LRVQHKGRQRSIPVQFQPRLSSFMAGIARQNGITPMAIGGFDDHAHVLIALRPTVTLAKAMQLIKAGSSKWCNQNFAGGDFEWQAGYGAMSVSTSLLAQTQRYIRNQREHHPRRTFAQEWKSFLEKNGFSLPSGRINRPSGTLRVFNCHLASRHSVRSLRPANCKPG
jgi:putative transposase